nr:PAS domain S-box protein [Nitrospirota bacterium]
MGSRKRKPSPARQQTRSRARSKDVASKIRTVRNKQALRAPKATEAALQASEARNRAIMASALDGIITINQEGRIVEFNPAAETMFGYVQKEVVGKEMAALIIPPSLRERHHSGFGRYLATGVTSIIDKRIEITAMRADGAEFPIELIVTRFGPEGDQTFAAFIRDITKRQETAAREAARFRKLRRLSELGVKLSGDPATIFEHVVRMIGELFEVRVVCLSEIVGGELLFKAVYRNGQVFQDAGRCPLDITPCATVEKTKDIRVYDRVRERFPKASFLRDHNAFAYCGFPSIDGEGRVVAVTCLLDDKPHEFSDEDQEILRVIGQRIAAEVERDRSITERKRAEEERRDLYERLQGSHLALRALSRRLMEVQEEERHHIARELHDEIGQALTVAKINIQQAMHALGEPTAGTHLVESVSLLDHTLQQVRNLALDLRPSLLDDLGLVPTLTWLAERHSQASEITVQISPESLDIRPAPEIELACYRVTQEALTNATRHARASRVHIELARSDRELVLLIRDNGIGFDMTTMLSQAAEGESIGLLGMQERVTLTGGEMEILSSPGQGTEIRARFPLDAPGPSRDKHA